MVAEGVTEIPKYFFGDGVSSLAKLSLPRTLQSIGVGAFKGCSSLSSLDLPEGVATIEGRAFEGSTSLKSLEIKRNITFSGTVSPFQGSGFETIMFRDGVTNIPNYMFADGCESLTSLYLPASIENAGGSAFRGCSALKELVVRSDISIPGVISPFKGSGLESITYQNGVTKIPGHMFDGGCGSLTSLYLPPFIELVGSGAFKGCASLTSLTIRSDIANPGVLPFSGNSLETLTFTSGVTRVANFLLDEDCASLMTLNIPSSMRTIGLDAFNGGESITVLYAGTQAQWASVYRSEWEPYAIVYGAAQPTLTGSLSAGRSTGRPTSALGKSFARIGDTEELEDTESAESEEPDDEEASGEGEPDSLEKSNAITPSSVRMLALGENYDGS